MDRKRIVIVGGGMAGISAALSATRNGADVLLIERRSSLGGTGVSGMVGPFLGIRGGDQTIIKGNFLRILRRMRDLFPESVDPFTDDLDLSVIRYDSEAMRHTLDVMLEEAGARVLLDTTLTDVERSENRVERLLLYNKSGAFPLRAEYFIDATGDADLFCRSGLKCELGRESDGRVQACTLRFVAGSIQDAPRVGKYLDSLDRDPGFVALLAEYGKRFGTDPSDMHFQNFCIPGREGSLLFNVPRVILQNPVDGQDLSDAYSAGRKLMRTYLAVLRERVPGCEKAVITNTAEALGIRESRRVVGAYQLNADDVADGRIFDDSVCASSWFIDIHNPVGRGVLGHTVDASGQAAARIPKSLYPEGGFHGIPYRSLYTEQCENLWAAGRCLSATHEALAAVRIMPSCIAMGEAVGIAAAMCAKEGFRSATVPIRRLQKAIVEQGGLVPGVNLYKK